MNQQELIEKIDSLEKKISELKNSINNEYVSKEIIRKEIDKLKIKRKLAIDNNKTNMANCLLFEIKHLENFIKE